MTSIDPINVNTQGIGNAYGFNGSKPKDASAKTQDATPSSTIAHTPVAANDVLSYMAQSAVSVTPTATKTIDPSHYVDSESAARIAGFMADFEDKVAQGLQAFNNEFPDSSMSDSAKTAVVLAGIDKQSQNL